MFTILNGTVYPSNIALRIMVISISFINRDVLNVPKLIARNSY